jgi:hypothetical protein
VAVWIHLHHDNSRRHYVRRTSEIHKRLRKWGLEEFGSLVGFARALGITQQTLNDYTSGRILPGNKMQSRLRSLGCDIEWLMTGPSPQILNKEPGSKGGTSVGWAKFEGWVKTSIDGHDKWEHGRIREGAGVPYRRGSFFCLEIENDTLLSAEPTPILPGDICIFEAERHPKNGEIVAVRLKKGKFLVRVMKHLSQSEVELDSANKYRSYPSIRIKKSDIEKVGVLKSVLQLTSGEKKFFGIE